MYPIFDTHAHYHDARFDEDPALPGREALLSSLFAGEISEIVNIGTDIETSREALALAERFPRMFAAVGMYPNSCPLTADDTVLTEAMDAFRSMLAHPKAAAIGEIGFDFHYDTVPHDIQSIWFERQLLLAEETGYPIIIHNREAHGATLALLKKHPEVRGILHSYSGSAETAETLIGMGYYISFSGVVTFKNASRLAEVVRKIPLDRMLVETDAPYLAPVPYRGRTNHSGYLPHTVETIAELHGVSPDEVRRITRENAYRIFRLETAPDGTPFLRK